MKTVLQSAALLLPLIAIPAHAQQIGSVASANAAFDGTPPGQSSRPLAVGRSVVRNERIETSATGSGQLLFLDQTTLSVAPDSAIVLDSYIYDPEQDSGEIAATLTKGVLRFIGGRITKRQEATIDTPVASIGIRGGLTIVEACLLFEPGCRDGVTVTHVSGQSTRVTAGGETVFLSRTSAQASVKPGGVPMIEKPASSADFARLNALLEGAGNGARRKPGTAALTERVARIRPVASGERGTPWRNPVSTSGEEFPSSDAFRERLGDNDPLAIFFDTPSTPIKDDSENLDMMIPDNGSSTPIRDDLFTPPETGLDTSEIEFDSSEFEVTPLIP